MLPNCKSRRGMTLAETMVAIGLVAIMIAMVVSFALLISERTRASNENLELMQERSLIKSGVENWLFAVTAENAALSLKTANPENVVTETKAGLEIIRPGSEATGCKVVTDNGLTLSFAYGLLKGQMPDGKTLTIRAESAGAIDFYLVKKMAAGEAEYIMYCVVTGEQGSYTFCVNPRVGEKGGVH